MAGCQFVHRLTHEKIADNQLKQRLCHSGDIDFDDNDGQGRRWVVELAQKAVKGLAQNQPGRGTPGNTAQCCQLPNLVPLEINPPKGFMGVLV